MEQYIKKDFFNNTPIIGDTVIYNPPYYKGLSSGEITGFTKAGLPTIDLHQSNFMIDKNNNLIVIDF